MTAEESTIASLNEKNAILNQTMTDKDQLTISLAKQVDEKAALLEAAVAEGNRIQDQFNEHMRTQHPAVTPPLPAPSSAYPTLFGLGGGNKVRTGIDLDRRYYQSGEFGKMIIDTTANEAKGILSWNSLKAPHGWADMANGLGDGWFNSLAKAVSEAIKPKLDDPDDIDEVWLSIHHEPEGDEPDERLWRAMQERLSLLVPGGSAGPIKFWLTTTGWGQEFNKQRVAQEVDWETSLWPKNGDIYGIGYDAPYNTYGLTKTGSMNNSWTDPYVYVDALAKRGVQFDCEVAIGEWGYSDEAFAKDKTWAAKVMDRALVNPHKKLRGMAYFDTTLNSARSWTLGPEGSSKRNYVMQCMANRKGK